jgi:hypothetical protein
MASVLEEILQTLDTESMEGCETAELGTLATVECSPPGPAPEVATRHDPETTAPRVERTVEGLNLKVRLYPSLLLYLSFPTILAFTFRFSFQRPV